MNRYLEILRAPGVKALVITTLIARFPGISLAAPPSQLRWRPVSLMNGLESLPVRLG